VSTVATVHSEGFDAAASGRAQLVVVEGDDMGRALRLEPGAHAVVGSDPTCDLVLTDERVSRRHLEVRCEPKGFLLRDLESRNGTFYEGSRLTEARVLAGATLKLGRTYLRILPEPEVLDVPPSRARAFGELVGESLAMREVFAVLERAAASDVTVLLEGETGTGKELAARGLHEASARRGAPFVAVDCGALPENLVESTLFGHLRGAFTGAAGAREGAFRRAEGGTLFLDELDSVPLPVQARLLRAIETREVRPLGSDATHPVDLRLLCASRSALESRVAEGAFRPDLYYRVSVLRVALPPLRSRREDVAPIVRALLRRRGITPGEVAGSKLDALFAHDWPGNVRELRNVIDRALALKPEASSFAELPLRLAPGGAGDDLAVQLHLPWAEAKARTVDAFEKRYLAALIDRCEGNVSAAAREAQMDRKHLRTLLEKHGLR